MYLLDTNVLSELRKVPSGRADTRVEAWAASADAESLYISVICLMELEIGTLLIERRDPLQGSHLRSWLNNFVLPAFSGRILGVDAEIALRAAFLHVPNPRPFRDSLIAATALVHAMTVVTRNVSHFAPTGVRILDPWES